MLHLQSQQHLPCRTGSRSSTSRASPVLGNESDVSDRDRARCVSCSQESTRCPPHHRQAQGIVRGRRHGTTIRLLVARIHPWPPLGPRITHRRSTASRRHWKEKERWQGYHGCLECFQMNLDILRSLTSLNRVGATRIIFAVEHKGEPIWNKPM